MKQRKISNTRKTILALPLKLLTTLRPPYQRIYLVLNPAAGGDEPVINSDQTMSSNRQVFSGR